MIHFLNGNDVMIETLYQTLYFCRTRKSLFLFKHYAALPTRLCPFLSFEVSFHFEARQVYILGFFINPISECGFSMQGK